MNNDRFKFRAWDGEKMEYAGMERMGGWHEMMDHPIMRWTGLHDKKNQEIYESDIVYVAGLGLLTVVWGVAEWRFIDNDGFGYEYTDILEDVETVFGNVYENPDFVSEALEVWGG